jgi:hypothetical protein
MIHYTSIISLTTLLFSGCGDNQSTKNISLPKDTTKLIRAVAQETDWTWFVGTDGSHSASEFTLDVYFSQNIPTEVKHFQYFLDTDNNAATGFSFGQDSWRISGADYLIEDNKLYKSNSNDTWSWTYIADFSTYTKSVDGNSAHIHISSQNRTITSIIKAETINITIEPFDADWGSTYSTISTQAVPLENNGGENPTETVYEDAENGLSGDWKTTGGNYAPLRVNRGFKSSGAVQLKTEWIDETKNISEYQLDLHHNTTQPILEVDIGGVGNAGESPAGIHSHWNPGTMPHYKIGVIATTSQGYRLITWSSFYTHSNIPATKRDYGSWVALSFPSPLEQVRWNSNKDLWERHRFDVEAYIHQLEPDNNLISIDKFIATGGNLDNIKLLSR